MRNLIILIMSSIVALNALAAPKCQGFNNYENKVTIVFTDDRVSKGYKVEDVKLIPSSRTGKEYPATSVKTEIKGRVATVTLTFPDHTEFSNPKVKLRINGKKTMIKVCQ